MLGFVLGAILARRAQAAATAALTLLAVTAAAAAPWYVAAAARAVVLSDVAAAPLDQRVIQVTGRVRLGSGAGTEPGSVLDRVRTEIGSVLAVPGAEPVAGMQVSGTLRATAGTTGSTLAQRDDACAHLEIEGSCPGAAGEVLVGAATARQLALGPGDQVRYEFGAADPIPLRVVGTYRLRDPLGPYWASTDVVWVGGDAREPVFTTDETIVSLPSREVNVDYGLVVPDEVILAGGSLDEQLRRLPELGYQPSSESGRLRELIVREERLVLLGVTVAAAQLVALCWFALFFAVRQTAELRRTDLGLLKLRGAARWRAWVATAGQSAVPAVVGALLGYGLGHLVARWLGGAAVDVARGATLSALAAGVAVLGALLAAVAAEWRAMRASVIDLLRGVPARQRGWRTDAVDLTVVGLALAAVYQAYATRDETSWLAMLAPALVALAVGLVVARAVVPLAQLTGVWALGTGRLGVALAATHLARRPGTHRVFALLAIAVALLTAGTTSWQVAADARDVRAVQDVGATRVLTVAAQGRDHLLAAVRAADPGGRSAMAVVRSTSPPVLALDATRLAGVASWAVDPGRLRTWLRPPVPDPITIHSGRLRLDVTAVPVPPGTAVVQARLSAGTVAFGPLKPGRHTYDATLSGCDGGCRLVSFELLEGPAPAAPGAAVELHELRGAAGALVPPEVFGDAARWRPVVGVPGAVPVISARDGRLALTVPDAVRRSTAVYVVDAPVPSPVVRAGPPVPPQVAGDPRLEVFGGDALPYQVVGTVPVLPQLGSRGMLVDLEYAARVATVPGSGEVYQVWLAATAPAALDDRLRAQGLSVLTEDSTGAARGRLDRQGPPAARRFQLLAAAIGLLLAAGALTVSATVERPVRAAEFDALRAQGLAAATVRSAAYGSHLALVAGALLTGILAALLAYAVVEVTLPIFVDGWAVLPIGTAPGWAALGVAAGAVLAVLGSTAALAAGRLVRAVRRR